MTLLIILVPLMALAVGIAVIPILYLSVREHNLTRYGSSTRPRPQKPVYAARKVEHREAVAAKAIPVAG